MANNFQILHFVVLLILQFLEIRCFIFSVIIPIYNTGRYLDEAISSLLNQTIGFHCIQIILINDGSNDQTEEISLQYKKIYPKNIIYIKTDHVGVSEARNIGIKYATGSYINFLDSDDKWDSMAFSYILSFFNINKDIELLGARIKFFELINAYHSLDYKFYKTRIVNLTQEYNCIQLSGASTIFKASFIKGKKFAKDISSGEDIKFINNILLVKPIIGMVREAIYFYRKRADYSSKLQNNYKKIDFYFYTLQNVHQYLIDSSKLLYNITLPFIQFIIGYDILYRISSYTSPFLDKINYNKYCDKIESLLTQIDEKYILEQKVLSYQIKLFALSKKYHKDLRYEVIFENESFTYSNHILIDLKKNRPIVWIVLEIKDNMLYLEGEEKFWMPRDKYFYFCKIGNKTFFPKYYYYSNYDFTTMYGVIERGRNVTFDIPLENLNNQTFDFYISYNGIIVEIYPSLGLFVHIPSINDGYYISGNYIAKNINNTLTIFFNNKRLVQSFEEQYCKQLEKKGKNYIIKLRKESIRYKNKIQNKEIWIIMDRPDKAGDIGEFFFLYLLEKNPKEIMAYFAISKNSSDYKRLKKYRNVINLDSNKYLKILLQADKIFSSSSNPWINNPLGNDREYVRDLFQFDLIFFQYGITKYDISKFFNRLQNNFKELENNYKLREKYYKRIKKFFTLFSKHNNDRLYIDIINKINTEKSFRESNSISLYLIVMLIVVKLMIVFYRNSIFNKLMFN